MVDDGRQSQGEERGRQTLKVTDRRHFTADGERRSELLDEPEEAVGTRVRPESPAKEAAVPASGAGFERRSLDEPEGRGGAETAGRRADLLAEAERAVKRTLVLERVAELHGLAATEPELDARVAEIASRGQVTPAQVRDQLVRTGRLDRLAADITHAKVFDFLKRRSRIVDEEGP